MTLKQQFSGEKQWKMRWKVKSLLCILGWAGLFSCSVRTGKQKKYRSYRLWNLRSSEIDLNFISQISARAPFLYWQAGSSPNTTIKPLSTCCCLSFDFFIFIFCFFLLFLFRFCCFCCIFVFVFVSNSYISACGLLEFDCQFRNLLKTFDLVSRGLMQKRQSFLFLCF